MARDEASARRVEVGFSGGQAIALRVARTSTTSFARPCSDGERLVRARVRRRRGRARPRAGRLREARHGRAPGRLLAAPERPRVASPRTLARACGGCATLGRGALVAQEPVGLPLQPALLGPGAAPVHHAQAPARDPRSRARASGSSRSGPGTGYYSLDVAVALDGRHARRLRHPAGDARPRHARSATSAASRTSTRRCGDARALPYDDDSFDAAFLVTVLGEIPTRTPALRELARVLRPGGRLVVGELFGDPHMVTFGKLRERAGRWALSFERRLGTPLGYFARFTAHPRRLEPVPSQAFPDRREGSELASSACRTPASRRSSTRSRARARRPPSTRSPPSSPNVAVVPVPDERLDRIADTLGIERRVREQIEFVDVAGLVRGAHQGEGLGNRFLGHIREVDAVLHVVRSFDNPQVAHPHGEIDPPRISRRSRPSCCWPTSSRPRRGSKRRQRRLRGGERSRCVRGGLLARVADELAAGRPAPRGGRPHDLEAGAGRRQCRRGRARLRPSWPRGAPSRCARSTRRS